MSKDTDISFTVDLTEWERQMMSDYAHNAMQNLKTDYELRNEKRWRDLVRKLVKSKWPAS